MGWSKKVPKIAHVIKGWFLTWRWREFLFRRTGSDKLPRYCAGESPRMRQMLILRTILLLLYCAIILFNEFINWYPNFCKWSSLKKKNVIKGILSNSFASRMNKVQFFNQILLNLILGIVKVQFLQLRLGNFYKSLF